MSMTMPIANKITNTNRYDAMFKTIPPNKGARIGAALFTKASIAINFVNSFPVYISRDAARAITIPAAPDIPYMNRKLINIQRPLLKTDNIETDEYDDR